MNSLEFNQKLHRARYCMQTHSHVEALQTYSQLVKAVSMTNLWFEYGAAATDAGEYDLAEQIWDTIRQQEPNTAQLLSRLAAQYGKAWLFTKARTLSREAARLEPNNLEVQLSLASFLARTNSVEEAREAVDRCLALDPKSEQARYLSAHLLRRENKLAEAEEQFRDLLNGDLKDPLARYFSHFELARILDQTERYREAMSELEKGKRLAAQQMNVAEARRIFNERSERILKKTRALPRNILSVWAQSFPPAQRASAPPVAFLGGHARSGTTLLERILDAHPGVAACDEALGFETIGRLIDIALPEIPVEGLNFLRRRYVRNMTKVLETPVEGKVLLDKNPPVTPYLGAFSRAFPELRVVIALRDPRDVLVSCYFQDVDQVTHFSFEALAQHYSCVMDVWLTVREWQGLNWMETRYEDIVADPHREGSRVTQFLGLEWHPNQERFYEQNREKPILCSNYNDVTKPVYRRAVGRWQAYEQYLAPVMDQIEPYCKAFGYG